MSKPTSRTAIGGYLAILCPLGYNFYVNSVNCMMKLIDNSLNFCVLFETGSCVCWSSACGEKPGICL